MIKKIKQILYFPVASYFKFFAQIQLRIWKPKIIVVTGSTGKTTLLHLIESQIGKAAKYSHRANSAFGIPFNILSLERENFTIWEWPILFLLAPFRAFQKLYAQKIYVVEADCDRPHEGKFLSQLLKPEISIWLSSSNSHAQNFPAPIEENIAYEFGYFLEYTSDYSIINGDLKLIENQLPRTKSQISKVFKKNLESYQILKKGTSFKVNDKTYTLNYLLPEDTFYLIAAVKDLLNKLDLPLDTKYTNLVLPPSRSSLLKGIKKTTIIDSSYNATPASMKVILEMFKAFPAKSKWLVLGDMIELGTDEQGEHQKLAKEIKKINTEKIILVGPRLLKNTYPELNPSEVTSFDGPKEALDYIKANIKGEEVLLFKGARFLEGIIEHLLENKSDTSKLCRRESIWQKRREKWGL